MYPSAAVHPSRSSINRWPVCAYRPTQSVQLSNCPACPFGARIIVLSFLAAARQARSHFRLAQPGPMTVIGRLLNNTEITAAETRVILSCPFCQPRTVLIT
jgi:hypothetical protein